MKNFLLYWFMMDFLYLKYQYRVFADTPDFCKRLYDALLEKIACCIPPAYGALHMFCICYVGGDVRNWVDASCALFIDSKSVRVVRPTNLCSLETVNAM